MMLAVLSSWAAVLGAQSYAPAPPAPRIVIVEPRKIVSSPNFGDYNIYPAEARAKEEEGRVDFELMVDRAGVPQSCLLLVESLSPSLNAATCEKALLIRFAPLRSAGPSLTPYRTAMNWRLSDPLLLGSSSLRTTFDAKESDDDFVCKVETNGPLAHHFEAMVCRGVDRLRAAARDRGARRRVELAIALDAGDGDVPEPTKGRLLASRRLSFTVNANGDATDCQLIEEKGAPLVDPLYPSPCGQFVGSAYFEPPAPDAEPVRATLDVRLTEMRR